MRFEFSDEQDMLRDTVRALFADRCPPEAVRASWGNDDGRVPGLWPALAEMGVLGLLAPEAAGGLGMDEVDLVLVMSVFPGFGGQRFMDEVLSKVTWLREQGYQGHVEMDGGINGETIGRCAAAGTDVFVAGSAIFGAPDRRATIAEFRQRAAAASRPFEGGMS